MIMVDSTGLKEEDPHPLAVGFESLLNIMTLQKNIKWFLIKIDKKDRQMKFQQFSSVADYVALLFY